MAPPPRPSTLTHAEVADLLQLAQPGAMQREEVSPSQPASSTWSYLDVRTPEEFSTGHVPGAYNIPYQLGDLAGLHPNPAFLRVVAATFSPEAPLIIGCRSGGRAASAERALKSAGFTELHVHLGSLAGARDAFGRIKPGWIQAGFTVAESALRGHSHAELDAAGFAVKPTRAGS
jgi:rhodanese-related sulfurtransferase